MNDIRVFLLDDHEILRAGLRLLLEQEPGFCVVGDAPDAVSALTALGSTQVDVVAVDVALRTSDGLDFVRDLQALWPNCQVLILSANAAPETVIEAFSAGARGFAQKTQPPAELFAALRTVAKGERYLAPTLPETLLADRPLRPRQPAPGTLASLSPRERELFNLAVCGLTNEEAARTLGISIKTVETHRAKINDKLNVHSVAQLMRFAARRGLAT